MVNYGLTVLIHYSLGQQVSEWAVLNRISLLWVSLNKLLTYMEVKYYLSVGQWSICDCWKTDRQLNWLVCISVCTVFVDVQLTIHLMYLLNCYRRCDICLWELIPVENIIRWQTGIITWLVLTCWKEFIRGEWKCSIPDKLFSGWPSTFLPCLFYALTCE